MSTKPETTITDMETRAFNCGRDDTDGGWIDAMDDGDLKQMLTAAYHEGQSESYECEDW